mmetsp:Transcript_16737/g.45325  ORF Transcript_16737/g.45325 Transcript_16737/m.45325 type:complete len:311 (-) Transcript_16737:216-1148(-)
MAPSPSTFEVVPPSPTLLLYYPLLAINVKILCEKEGWKKKASSSRWFVIIDALRLTYETEGLVGLYRGGHTYLLHHAVRECLKFAAGRCIDCVERLRGKLSEPSEFREAQSTSQIYGLRTVVKYAIDIVCYPLLLCSTREIILGTSPLKSLQVMRGWCSQEGTGSLFNGVSMTLLSSMVDQIMNEVVVVAVGWYMEGCPLDEFDKLLLNMCSFQVVSICTEPLSHVGVIQRCQSSLPGLLSFRPQWKILTGLPWKGSLCYFAFFAAILGLNVKTIRWKLDEMQNSEEVLNPQSIVSRSSANQLVEDSRIE